MADPIGVADASVAACRLRRQGWLRIDPGEAKDASAGREFQFTTWMREALERQRKFVSAVERTTKTVIPWVFCRPDGRRIHRFYDSWRDACGAAGINRIPHDFRRTAVRNLERAGVPRATAMAMIGHRTESIYRRYSIVDQGMLEMGTSRLEELQRFQRSKPPVVVSMNKKRSPSRQGVARRVNVFHADSADVKLMHARS